MRNVLDSIWWWTRLVVLVLVGVYILALLFNNSGQTATLWYWVGRQSDNIPIITIVLVSFLAGGVVSITAWALTSAMLTYRRTREERRGHAERERLEAMHRKAGMLRTKPAPTPVVRRPPEDRPRTLPSLDATPDETNARFDDDEAAPTSFPRGDESVDETTDEPPMTEPTSLPMPPMPLAARPAEPASNLSGRRRVGCRTPTWRWRRRRSDDAGAASIPNLDGKTIGIYTLAEAAGARAKAGTGGTFPWLQGRSKLRPCCDRAIDQPRKGRGPVRICLEE